MTAPVESETLPARAPRTDCAMPAGERVRMPTPRTIRLHVLPTLFMRLSRKEYEVSIEVICKLYGPKTAPNQLLPRRKARIETASPNRVSRPSGKRLLHRV